MAPAKTTKTNTTTATTTPTTDTTDPVKKSSPENTPVAPPSAAKENDLPTPPPRKRGRPLSRKTIEKRKALERANNPVQDADTDQPATRKRGRPRKVLTEEDIKRKQEKEALNASLPKRGRGRPRKVPKA